MRTVKITEIEQAINIWRSRKPANDQTATLCKEASILVDVYGPMIVFHQTSIDFSALNPEQAAALSVTTAPSA